MSEKDKKHPSPMQRALIADVLLGLCDALITDDSETDAKSKTTGKKASK